MAGFNKNAATGAVILAAAHYGAHNLLPAPYNTPLYVTFVVLLGYYFLSQRYN